MRVVSQNPETQNGNPHKQLNRKNTEVYLFNLFFDLYAENKNATKRGTHCRIDDYNIENVRIIYETNYFEKEETSFSIILLR